MANSIAVVSFLPYREQVTNLTRITFGYQVGCRA